MGHFIGGGTYVSARAELVSVLDASDMEQRLSKGLAHLSSQTQTADSALIFLCLLGLRARINTTRSIFQGFFFRKLLYSFCCCFNCCRNAM